MLSLHERQLIAGKYRLIRPLAKGGMGSVWTAKHIALNVPVAIKFMDPRYADLDDLRARFEREAMAAAQLRVPNVVQIFDYGIQEDTPYIVMEFLRGEDLNARLAREGRLSVSDTVAILTQVCKALRRAHDEGIVHRDLKPANVFLVIQDDELLVKVLDFGIAKVLRSETAADATKTGEVMGSPAYMSPEQVRGAKDIDHRTDLWSLGVIVYRALTGVLPFPGANSGDMFVKICVDEPLPPTRVIPDLDTRVDAFMARALAKNPSLRFTNAKEMAENLAKLDQHGTARGVFKSMPFWPSVDGATNAPMTSNVIVSNRKKTKNNLRLAAFIGLSTIVMMIVVAVWASREPTTPESVARTPAFSDATVPSASIPEVLPADVPSAIPIPSTSTPNMAEPTSKTTSSSKTPSVPQKTSATPAPKSSANYSLRKEL